MMDIIIIQLFNQAHCLVFLPLCLWIQVNIFKHIFSEADHCSFHLFGHDDRRFIHTVDDHVMYHGVQTFFAGITKNPAVFVRDILLHENASPDCIVDVVIDIGYLIRKTEHLALQGAGSARCGMVQDTVQYFPCQVQAGALLLHTLHDSHALFVMGKMVYAVQGALPCVAKRRMPQIVAQCNCLYQILIQPEGLCNRPRILRDLQRMRQPCPIVIPFGQQKNLGLLLQAPEGLAVQNPVPVALKYGPDIAFRLLPLSSL